MYCDLCSQYIQVRKLFKGGNYSRAETIRGNMVFEIPRFNKYQIALCDTLDIKNRLQYCSRIFDVQANLPENSPLFTDKMACLSSSFSVFIVLEIDNFAYVFLPHHKPEFH